MGCKNPALILICSLSDKASAELRGDFSKVTVPHLSPDLNCYVSDQKKIQHLWKHTEGMLYQKDC